MKSTNGIRKKCRCARSQWETTCVHAWYLTFVVEGKKYERSLRKLALVRRLSDPRTFEEATEMSASLRDELMVEAFKEKHNNVSVPEAAELNDSPSLLPTMTTSQAVYEGALKRRRTMPTIVHGVLLRGERDIPVDQLKSIGIDERYQRMRITNKVNSLIVVIKSGGLIPDPVSLVERPDGTLWIVNGQQRYWAHYDTDSPMRARIYAIDPEYSALALDIERRLFSALNNSRAQTTGTTIKAHAGLSAEILRQLNEDPNSTIYQRVLFESRGGTRKNELSAASLIRGMLLSAAGARPSGSLMERVLPRADLEMAKPDARCRVDAYLRLVGLVFPPLDDGRGLAPALAIRALGSICYQKWKTISLRGAAPLPDHRVVNRLRRIKWKRIAESVAERFMPLYEDAILKIWKE